MRKLSQLTRPVLAAASLLFVSLSAFAGENATVLSFDQYYQRVAAYYPSLQIQNQKTEQAITEKLEAYLMLVPQVHARSAATTGDDPVYVFGSLLKQEAFTADHFDLNRLNSPRHRTNYHFGLQAEVMLFNAFETVSMIRMAHFSENSAQEMQRLKESETLLVAYGAYLRALESRRIQTVVRLFEDAAQIDLGQAEELREKGRVLGADFFAARFVSNAIRQIQLEADAQSKVSEMLLNILMGEDPLTAQALMALRDEPDELKALDDYLVHAEKERPDLESARQQKRAARTNLFKSRAAFLPRVKAQADLTLDTHSFEQSGENYVMGLYGEMPLLEAPYFTGVEKAKLALKEADQEYLNLRDEIRKQVIQTYYQAQTLRFSLPFAKQAFEDAWEAVRQTEVLYREGRKSIADLMEIRQACLQAVQHYETLRVQTHFMDAQLLFVSGQLTAESLPALAERFTA